MFEEYLLNHLHSEFNTVLPDMLRVGSFNRAGAKIPVFLPFLTANGICYITNDDLDRKAIQQMQYMALELTKYMDPELLSLKFVDVGLNTRYPILSAIKSSQFTFITSRDRLNEELDAIIERARYISNECIGYQYSDLESYNTNNPDLKEAYVVFFISCFPRDFDDSMFSKLSLIIREGKKCGIRVVMNMSLREWNGGTYQSAAKRVLYNDINSFLIQIDCTNPKNALHKCGYGIYNRFATKYEFGFDEYSSSEIHNVVSSLKESIPVNEDVKDFLCLPIGKSGRNTIHLEMGLKSGIYHGFIAGQSGSGKTNLLHNIITSIAKYYSPDDLRLYLLDYKWGIEFQVYENHPNVEYLLLDNENIESGINLLKELRKEFVIRSNEFMRLGKTINNIDEYNKKAAKKMPHILVIIDEVQQLFSSFAIKREVNPILKEVAKQGRAFGVHLLFSTQSYAQCDIDSDTLSQMPLRIAFALSSGAECRAIMGLDNDAPMSLPPYSAIYNKRNGDKKYNTIVKIDYFDKDTIQNVLYEAERKFRGYTPFKKRVIRHSEKETTTADKTHHSSPSGVVHRPEYDNVDYEKMFGF